MCQLTSFLTHTGQSLEEYALVLIDADPSLGLFAHMTGAIYQHFALHVTYEPFLVSGVEQPYSMTSLVVVRQGLCRVLASQVHECFGASRDFIDKKTFPTTGSWLLPHPWARAHLDRYLQRFQSAELISRAN